MTPEPGTEAGRLLVKASHDGDDAAVRHYGLWPAVVLAIEAEARASVLAAVREGVEREKPAKLTEPFDYGFAEGIRCVLALLDLLSNEQEPPR